MQIKLVSKPWRILNGLPLAVSIVILCAGVVVGSDQPTTRQVAKNAHAHDDATKAIAEVNIPRTSLEHAVELLRRQTQLNIVVRWDELERAGIHADAPVELHVWDTTCDRALLELFVLAGDDRASMILDYNDDFVVVGLKRASNDRPMLYTRIYDVRDLIDESIRFHRNYSPPVKPPATQPTTRQQQLAFDEFDGGVEVPESVESLIRAIEDTVDPTSWKDDGGDGNIREFGGRLIISQTARIHAEVADFLRALRSGGRKEGANTSGR